MWVSFCYRLRPLNDSNPDSAIYPEFWAANKLNYEEGLVFYDFYSRYQFLPMTGAFAFGNATKKYFHACLA